MVAYRIMLAPSCLVIDNPCKRIQQPIQTWSTTHANKRANSMGWKSHTNLTHAGKVF